VRSHQHSYTADAVVCVVLRPPRRMRIHWATVPAAIADETAAVRDFRAQAWVNMKNKLEHCTKIQGCVSI
jgi:hypothetical protein